MNVQHVLRQVFATPGALISVYKVFTVSIPFATLSAGVFDSTFFTPIPSGGGLPPNLSRLSLSSYSIIFFF